MIYRRENPTTPSKRFKSILLNPIGIKIKKKNFFLNKKNSVGFHFGKKIIRFRHKTLYKTHFNIYYGLTQNKNCIISEISLSRRYKTFVGLVRYSNGALSCLPIFSGAYLNQTILIYNPIKYGKTNIFMNIKTGTTLLITYLAINNCCFNIMYSFNKFVFFCRAGGTYCLVIRLNIDKKTCTIKLSSGKFYKLYEHTYAMLGRNSNNLIKGIWLGKAGINIKRGYRSVVRGVAMNPIDHPHGGRTKSNSPERTPWGHIAKFNK